ncbi:MAG: deoxyribonuclease IV [Clostridia bacterium]|nr:deoxyribonuclease IV [Clostridia bacterium]
MLKIGCHLSSSAGYLAMGEDAAKIGANTFAFFTRNPRGGSAKPINETDVARFLGFAAECGISPLVAHSPYTLNPCSAKPELREFAKRTMADDLARMEYTPGNFYNFHPGSHTGQGEETGLLQCAEMLNEILPLSGSTTVLIETMAGKGSEIGKSFAQIAKLISMVEIKEKVGVCLDTCHIWDGGYDIAADLDGVLTEFDNTIGLSKLRAVHLNDSLNPCGARKDRHAKIGEGQIGKEALFRVINHEALYALPFILETPQEDLVGYAAEIAMLREAYRH